MAFAQIDPLLNVGLLLAAAMIVAMLGALVTRPADAALFDGPAPPRVAADGVPLALNGGGERVMHAIPVYSVALYLPQRSGAAEYALDPETPSALRIEIRFPFLPRDMPAEWESALRAELGAAEYFQMRDAYRKLRLNDVVLISYTPEAGSAIAVNGSPVLRDSGHGLMRGFLQHWLGADAVSQPLRAALLNSAPLAHRGAAPVELVAERR